MKPILIIAPHKKIEKIAKALTADYDDVEVKLALLEEAIEVARFAEKQGVEAIISRGGTARIIEKAVPSVPVIEIQVSTYELLQAVHTAKIYGNNIFIIGFKNIIDGADLLGSILETNIQTYYMENEEDGERYIKDLIDSGKKIDALLGGTVAENLAYKYNIPTVQLETGTSALEISIREARRIARMARKEKEKTEQLNAILHYINEGVISIDSNKRITTLNSAAAKMIGVYSKDVIGRAIDEVIPNTRLDRVIEKNLPELDQLFQMGKAQVLTNKVPIILGGKTVGAVATFQDITKIQEYERRIRAKLLDKGHVAKYSFSEIIGQSELIVRAKEKARRYSLNNSTVLIVGESGTGKEMFAQSIHLESSRGREAFVAVNCAAISQNLLESELFGYEEGAFTGARKTGKSGLFTEAHGGTIFLDEIAEISIELQARLLRVLQEKEVRPVGSNKVIPIDIRIIAATNKNLLKEVEKGNFREDLYYRLNILKLQVTPLRSREGDIKLLGNHFVDRISSKYNKIIKISGDALDKLRCYPWPGNVRELENVIERLVVLNDEVITGKEVDEVLKEQREDINWEQEDFNQIINSLEEVKKRHIYKILSECNNNQSLAAQKLGISRTHLWRIINKD
jgi:PAS domain S-box-containing protein